MAKPRSIAAAMLAGIAYFAIVFAAGFMLGMVRVRMLQPRLGEVGAVAVELPMMLAFSWVVCGWLVERLSIPWRAADRLTMGGVAFVLLMAAELLLGVAISGGSVTEQFAAYRSAAGMLGLAGQAGFAVLPLLLRRRTANV